MKFAGASGRFCAAVEWVGMKHGCNICHCEAWKCVFTFDLLP